MALLKISIIWYCVACVQRFALDGNILYVTQPPVYEPRVARGNFLFLMYLSLTSERFPEVQIIVFLNVPLCLFYNQSSSEIKDTSHMRLGIPCCRCSCSLLSPFMCELIYSKQSTHVYRRCILFRLTFITLFLILFNDFHSVLHCRCFI